MDDFNFDTLAIRAGQVRSNFQEHSEAIYPTSSFIFKSAEEAAARFSGEEEAHFYTRVSNPTVSCFQDRLAALEGGEMGLATSTGMSAILAVMLGTLKPSSFHQLKNRLYPFRIDCSATLIPGYSAHFLEPATRINFHDQITGRYVV